MKFRYVKLTFATILHVAFILLPAHNNYVQGQNIYDLEHSLDYAKHLSTAKKHHLAVREYERLSYFYPHNDTLSYLLMQSYRRSTQYDAGIDHIEQHYDPSAISAQIANEYATLLLLKRSHKKLNLLLDNNANLSNDDRELLEFKSLLVLNRWEDAGKYFTRYDSLSFSSYSKYGLIINKSLGFKKKRAGVALGLSLVPGMGKIYTNNAKDGLVSLFIVGITSFLSYRGFSQKGIESIPGWFYGSLGFGFYIGNLYGSYRSAKRYNTIFHENINNELEDIIVNDH